MKEAKYLHFMQHKSTHENFILNIGRYKIAFNEKRDIASQHISFIA
ncbi:MAG: hypothetical protein LBF13_06045 [Campylobacteraceae bacterium]|nr:hypothetical protein [Campylobacteraceae bacterium]